MTNPSEVGFYVVPLRLVKMFWSVVAGIGTALIPRIANLFANNDNDAITLMMKKSFTLIFLLTIPFSFYCLIFPKEILFIISGKKYLDAANVLRILAFVPLIVGICNIVGSQFLLPIGEEKRILIATIVGLVVSLMMNYILIPSLSFFGTAVSCTLAELSVCIFVLYSAKKRIVISIDHSILKHIILSLVIAGISIVVFEFFLTNLIIVMIASFIVYIAAFILFQFLVFKNSFLFSLIMYKL